MAAAAGVGGGGETPRPPLGPGPSLSLGPQLGAGADTRQCPEVLFLCPGRREGTRCLSLCRGPEGSGGGSPLSEEGGWRRNKGSARAGGGLDSYLMISWKRHAPPAR